MNARLACEHLRGALAAGREKERELATTSLYFEYLHRKRRCEMLIGGDDISYDVITPWHVFFHSTFALVSASRWLAKIWQLSRRRATGELEVEFKFQRRSCKLSFLLPPRRQSAPESLLAGQLNIVGCYTLHPFSHPVACCCVLLGVVVQSLEPIKRLETMLAVFASICSST